MPDYEQGVEACSNRMLSATRVRPAHFVSTAHLLRLLARPRFVSRAICRSGNLQLCDGSFHDTHDGRSWVDACGIYRVAIAESAGHGNDRISNRHLH